MKNVLVLFAEGSEELEAITIVNILRRAGVSVTLAGLNTGALRGSRGVMLMPDKSLDDVLHEEFDMVVLPGGQPGTNHLKADARVLGLVQRMEKQGKYVAAICAAPSVLATAGLLDGRTGHQFPRRAGPLPQGQKTAHRHRRRRQDHHFARAGHRDGFRADPGRTAGRFSQTAGSRSGFAALVAPDTRIRHLRSYLTTLISLIEYCPLRASTSVNETFCPFFRLASKVLS